MHARFRFLEAIGCNDVDVKSPVRLWGGYWCRNHGAAHAIGRDLQTDWHPTDLSSTWRWQLPWDVVEATSEAMLGLSTQIQGGMFP